jgi:hypothetical protein
MPARMPMHQASISSVGFAGTIPISPPGPTNGPLQHLSHSAITAGAGSQDDFRRYPTPSQTRRMAGQNPGEPEPVGAIPRLRF